MFKERGSVQRSPCLTRVKALPKREYTDPQIDHLVATYTDALKQPRGTWTLKPIQALALHEIAKHRALFGPIPVGGGKTLISLLAPVVTQAKRPVLLLPANLVEKTYAEQRMLSEHWVVSRHIKVISYEMLGRVSGKELLEQWQPDLLILDECHRAKNRKAACTRRISRYMQGHPATNVVAISGTVMTKSIRDFAHIVRWCLKEAAPVPALEGVLEEWSNALDPKVNFLQRLHPGALFELFDAPPPEGPESEDAALLVASEGFRKRLLATPGIVAPKGTVDVGASLLIAPLEYKVDAVSEAYFKTLRTRWETPDGWALTEGMEVWRHAQEIALGFFYRWDPRPPAEWLDARREWASFVREVLKHTRTWDTELEVRLAVEGGDPRVRHGAEALTSWKALEKTFEINQEMVWHSDTVIELARKWVKDGPGIVWTKHSQFGKHLAKSLGLDYYGSKSLNARGEPIRLANPKKPIVASVDSNGTGQNLQFYARNLICCTLDGSEEWEQTAGRTHRQGQTADNVEIHYLLGCIEHKSSFDRALQGARMCKNILGVDQKLLIADTIQTSMKGSGFAWTQ